MCPNACMSQVSDLFHKRLLNPIQGNENADKQPESDPKGQPCLAGQRERHGWSYKGSPSDLRMVRGVCSQMQVVHKADFCG